MSKDEIIKYLRIIDYRKEDNSIRGAMGRLLESEKYGPAYRGVISDSKIREELIEIIDAFKKLKDLTQEEIIEATKCMFNDQIAEEKTHEFVKNQVYEFIKYFDNGLYHISKKNTQTDNYEETISYDERKGDYVTGNYVVKKNDGIYDCFGKKVYPYKQIKFIGSNYCQNQKDKSVYYNLLDGENLDIAKIGNAKTLMDLIEYNTVLKVELLSYLFQKRNLSYLNYKIEKITSRYLYCTNGNEVCYFDLNGEKIISTENSIYSFIDKPFKGNYFSSYKYKPSKENNIVIVGQYDKNFNQKYGYYDLESRKEISKPMYDYLTDWIDICGIGDCKDIITKNKIIKCNINEVLGRYMHGELKNIIDIGNNYYLIDNCNNLILVYDLLNNPKRIAWIDGRICMCIHDKYIIEEKYGRRGYVYCENGEFKKLTISSLLKICSGKNVSNCKADDKENNLLLKSNSAFLLDIYKTSFALDSDESKCSLVKKDKINYLIESQNIEGMNSMFYNDEISLHKDEEIFPCNWGPNFMEFELVNGEKHLITLKNNKILNSSNFDLLWIDDDDNIAISIKWGNGKKEFVLGNDGNILLGPVDHITWPRQNMMIVTNQNKMMLYMNYIPLSCQADKYEFISKYYIIKNNDEYEIVNSKDIVFVQNEDNLYVIDDDGDKVIRMSQKTKDLMELLSDNDLPVLNEKKQKTRRLTYERN